MSLPAQKLFILFHSRFHRLRKYNLVHHKKDDHGNTADVHPGGVFHTLIFVLFSFILWKRRCLIKLSFYLFFLPRQFFFYILAFALISLGIVIPRLVANAHK